ncbi:MAG: type III-B CRISPR module RAMP protein Cmr4 [Eubacteriales bacterium]
MFSDNGLLFLHAVTSIHAGSGNELGLVDLPIQREKHTGYPKIESSSLKGAIRATVQARVDNTPNAPLMKVVFGKESAENKNDAQAGAISFSDARILLFPVKSLRGVFAWITCPQVLKRFNEELKLYRTENNLLIIPSDDGASVSSNSLIVNSQAEIKQVVLEEYTYKVQQTGECQELANQLMNMVFNGIDNGFSDRLIVLPDNDFVDFVTLSTEVNARIRIDPKTGTVQNGALWYEENVPPETVFYSYCFAGNSRVANQEKKAGEVLDFLKQEEVFPSCFQLGGNSSLGKGILRRIWQ